MKDIKQIKEILKLILLGNSLRSIEKECNLNREEIMKIFKDLFKNNPRELEMFEQIIAKNTIDNISIMIDEKKIESLTNQIIDGKITMQEASDILQIDNQTWKEKMVEYINNTDNISLKKRFIEYTSRLHPDYSFINFKALCIEMIKCNLSQSEMAREYSIPARTISREIEKFQKEKEYEQLYNICKEYSNKKMKRERFSLFEEQLINRVLEKYDEKSIIINNAISKEEKRYQFYIEQINKAELNGNTNAQKSKSIGVSESTYRRMKIYARNYIAKKNIEKEIEERGK